MNTSAEIAEFIRVCRESVLTERSGSQSHFISNTPLPPGEGLGVRAYPDRIIPKPEHAAELKKRTLTNLYNQRPAWLDQAHRALDEAVAAPYGWPVDLSDDEILHRLLALNRERCST